MISIKNFTKKENKFIYKNYNIKIKYKKIQNNKLNKILNLKIIKIKNIFLQN